MHWGRASSMAQQVKNLPAATQETQGMMSSIPEWREDSLEKEMAYCCLENPMDNWSEGCFVLL